MLNKDCGIILLMVPYSLIIFCKMESRGNIRYIFNPKYILINDKKRILLANQDEKKGKEYMSFIHPIFAIYLSFFDGTRTYKQAIDELVKIFSCTGDDAHHFLLPFIENEKAFAIQYDNTIFYFPEQVLIKAEGETVRTDMDRENYIIMPPYDFSSERLSYPHSVLFVLNTSCVTDCIYCYADRRTKYTPLQLEKILDFIVECKQLGVRDLDISGGDLFTHPDWETILKAFLDNGYNPYISTKYPLTENMINKIWDFGLREIQISLDSLSPLIQQNNLKVNPNYTEKMLTAIRLLDQKGFSIILKSTVTKQTCTLENISEIVDFAKTLNHITRYTFTPIGYSHYKTINNFNDIKPLLDQVSEVSSYLKECMSIVAFEILIDDGSVHEGRGYCNAEKFNNRSLCSGNVRGAIVLPDGKVTICEELYWNENFILGDINHNSLFEIWNSKKAYNLWKLKQKDFPDASACKTCKEFESCRYVKGVCWKAIIASYGKENWLMPDPTCPQAPSPLQATFYDNSIINTYN